MTRTDRTTTSRRVASLIAAMVFLFAACSGATSSTAPTAAPAAGSAAATSSASYQVKVAEDPQLGAYLTGKDGKSLYLLTADSADTTTCTGSCATAWPPFELDAGESVTGGDGVTGVLASLTRADDGKQQVTYDGIPLYYFAKDTKAGDINGQGVKGVWFLVAPGSTAKGGPITGGVGQGATVTPSAAPSEPAGGGYSRGPAASSPAATGGASAKIANFAFAPVDITVTVGETVTWTNADSPSHTVTADDGSFDSGGIAPGATFSQSFTKAGTYAYHCTIHPSMTGTVTVTP
jgi:plastocyanin/predicted lipoprotein with Yx(FWY)xxD motif